MARNFFGERVKQLRKQANITQADLAKKVGVSQPAVASWESGASKTVKPEHLIVISYLFNVSPEWLATGKNKKNQSFLNQFPNTTRNKLESYAENNNLTIEQAIYKIIKSAL
ncbi:helix-turn-helix domain-containing protein [Piscirickettsia litoralis]|uniref:HTH cro/C1-type domain-containing protein n=1 Tax=Piscirickettsia litoralis TaxID=1891921 RepID=A0ABX2ZX39_9GAMM|nr:helix-turn-helix transcriptional regulator [Piscirickettsia litoralis]ODN40944.1 hypothetical protein BGC07_18960 [Piscirickettsia litoralis]